MNGGILFVMHLIAITTIQRPQIDTITSFLDEETREEFVMDATSVDQVGTNGDLSQMAMSLAAAPDGQRYAFTSNLFYAAPAADGTLPSEDDLEVR